MLSDEAVEILMDELAGMIIGVLPAIVVDVLMDVNVNAFAGVIAVEFVMSAALGGSKC